MLSLPLVYHITPHRVSLRASQALSGSAKPRSLHFQSSIASMLTRIGKNTLISSMVTYIEDIKGFW